MGLGGGSALCRHSILLKVPTVNFGDRFNWSVESAEKKKGRSVEATAPEGPLSDQAHTWLGAVLACRSIRLHLH